MFHSVDFFANVSLGLICIGFLSFRRFGLVESTENTGYPSGVFILIVIKTNDQTVFQAILASQRRFNSFTNLTFKLLLFYISRLLIF